MRIDSGLPLQNTVEIDRTARKPVQREAENAVGLKSELSSDAVLLSSLARQEKNIPEVRQEKVSELKNAIAAGTYEVSDQALADAIARDIVRR